MPSVPCVPVGEGPVGELLAPAADGGKWRWQVWLLPALAVLSAAPLWLVRTPPLQDLPQHLAAIRVLHSHGDAAFGMGGLLELHLWRTQYLAYYLCADGLSYLVDIETANRLLMSAAVVATPMSLAALLRALGRDPRAALLAVPLCYNAQLILGFLNFIAAIPLCFYGLALAVRVRRQPSGSARAGLLRGAWLSALLLACFFMHVVPFCFLALGVGLCALQRDRRAMLRGLWPLLPSAAGVVLWALGSAAGQATLRAAGAAGDTGDARGRTVKATYWAAEEARRQLPAWLTDVLHGERDQQLLWATLALWVLWSVLGGRGPVLGAGGAGVARSLAARLSLLPVLAVVFYFALPTGYDWIWPIAPRFALLAWLLSLPLLPMPGPRALAVLSLCAALLGLGHIGLTGRAFADFERQEVGEFDAALSAIPQGKRVAGLIFDRGSRQVRFSPFLHYVALYQARRGGAVMFSFADFAQSPFSFNPEDRPPRVRPRWEWTPRRVNPARELGWYDYVLVRGGPGRIAGQRDHYRRVHRSRRWSVWQRVGDKAGGAR